MGLLEGPRSRPFLAGRTESVTPQSVRLKVLVLGAFVILLFSILTLQLIRLQLLRHDEFDARATINRVRTLNAPAVRGLIYDRDGNLLVNNVPGFAITVIPADIPDGSERAVAIALAQMVEAPAYEIEAGILAGKRSNDPFRPVVVEADASEDLAFEIAARRSGLPGVRVDAVAKREYTQGNLLSGIVGYIGPITAEEYEVLSSDRYRLSDRIGQTGVEAEYESVLRGVPGRRQVEVDATGRELRTLNDEDPTPGDGLVLTLDTELQRETQKILQESMGGSVYATAIVVDVNTGEVLSMVSLPTYDANIFSGGLGEGELAAILHDPGRPLVNHAIADQFPPGSIFKVITGAAALAEGIVTPQTRIFSPGVIQVQNEVDPRITYTFRDTTSGVFDFRLGLAESSNVYFWYLAGGSPYRRPVAEELLTPEDQEEQRELIQSGIIGGDQDFVGLGEDDLSEWARRFGLDSPTGIDLIGEASGFIPDADWKLRTFGEAWGQGDSYNFGIGQGFVAVTPIQMAMVTAAIANGGTLYEPRVVREILDPRGNPVEPFQPVVRSRLDIDPELLRVIREGMALSVLGGTSGNAWYRDMLIAGKTGTAEFGDERLFRGLFPTHGWFIGFAPFGNPQVAVAVFHELGAGYLSAITGGEILHKWAELSGALESIPASPAPRTSLDESEVERLKQAVRERSN